MAQPQQPKGQQQQECPQAASLGTVAAPQGTGAVSNTAAEIHFWAYSAAILIYDFCSCIFMTF